jgi:hypothetical protein
MTRQILKFPYLAKSSKILIKFSSAFSKTLLKSTKVYFQLKDKRII